MTTQRTAEAPRAARPASPTTIPCFDPASGESLGEAKVFSPDAVRDAVARARRAQGPWGQASFATRRKVLRKVLRIRKQDRAKRLEEEAITDLYLSALGEI